MWLSILGSDSSGNVALVCNDTAALVIDAGLSLRKLKPLLGRLPDRPPVVGILLTHHHGDHAGQINQYADYFQCPVYMTEDCYGFLEAKMSSRTEVVLFSSGDLFAVSDFKVTAFPVAHCMGSVGYRISHSGRSMALIGDCGTADQALAYDVRGVNLLAVDCNYSKAMMAESDYDDFLKKRIEGDFGHLSTEDIQAWLPLVITPELHAVALLHLSHHTITPLLARTAAQRALNGHEVSVLLPCEAAIPVIVEV
jgi:phosphoribosyl 1,2-cyclic phosphodiesterase